MTTGKLSIDFHPNGEIEIKEPPTGSTDDKLRVFSKTPEDFLNNDNYTAPKYATWTSVTSETGETISAGTMSCDAKKTVYSSESPLILQINGERILSSQNKPLVGKSYKSFSEDFNTDKSVIINLKQDDLINLEGDYTGYLTLAGPASWSCQVGLSWHSFYLKHPMIVLNYICPKFTISLETNDSAMGTATFAEGSSSKEFDVTEKKWTKTTTITATPNDGYFFIKYQIPFWKNLVFVSIVGAGFYVTAHFFNNWIGFLIYGFFVTGFSILVNYKELKFLLASRKNKQPEKKENVEVNEEESE